MRARHYGHAHVCLQAMVDSKSRSSNKYVLTPIILLVRGSDMRACVYGSKQMKVRVGFYSHIYLLVESHQFPCLRPACGLSYMQ